MRIFEYLEKLKLFTHLIESEATGTPSEFAERLGISRATLYNVIEELNSMGLGIAYSRTRFTFYYTNSAQLDVQFKIQVRKEK